MQKFLPFVLVIGLTGCAGAPLVSSGLSAEPTVAPVAELPPPAALPPALPPQRVARRKAVVHVAASKPPVESRGDLDDMSDDKADRAARALDREAHRLDRVARQATSSICRGC